MFEAGTEPQDHTGRLLPAPWFERDAPTVARDLLNKLLVARLPDHEYVAGRIVEVEAYTQDDPASHTFTGRTSRNEVMFGPPGNLYVYLSYGIHCCANIVTGPEGDGQAVLLRAVIPERGINVIRSRRQNRPDRNLADGPGKICQAFAIALDHNGVDLTEDSSPIQIIDDGVAAPLYPRADPRVGISKGVSTLWRFRTPIPR